MGGTIAALSKQAERLADAQAACAVAFVAELLGFAGHPQRPRLAEHQQSKHQGQSLLLSQEHLDKG